MYLYVFLSAVVLNLDVSCILRVGEAFLLKNVSVISADTRVHRLKITRI